MYTPKFIFSRQSGVKTDYAGCKNAVIELSRTEKEIHFSRSEDNYLKSDRTNDY